MIRFEEFKESLNTSTPSKELSGHLRSLWYDANGEWNRAHEIIQDIDDKSAAWVHAYLHRKEGDIGNADYWYGRAGRKRPTMTLADEWGEIVKALL